MASVFVVQHVHSREDGEEDVKFVGVSRGVGRLTAPWHAGAACPASPTRRTRSMSMSIVSIRINGSRGR